MFRRLLPVAVIALVLALVTIGFVALDDPSPMLFGLSAVVLIGGLAALIAAFSVTIPSTDAGWTMRHGLVGISVSVVSALSAVYADLPLAAVGLLIGAVGAVVITWRAQGVQTPH